MYERINKIITITYTTTYSKLNKTSFNKIVTIHDLCNYAVVLTISHT